jgi:hypothetical protein
MTMTMTIPGVPILRSGKGFNGVNCPTEGCDFTLADLDAIEAAHWATREALFVPLKIGHKDRDGAPAHGWVENVKRSGDRLLADLVGVTPELAEAIRAKRYRSRSVELRREFQVGGVTYPLVLVGLALLGAELPAVDGLGDIALAHEHHPCGCPDPLAPTPEELLYARQLGVSTAALVEQKAKDAATLRQGEQDAIKILQQLGGNE